MLTFPFLCHARITGSWLFFEIKIFNFVLLLHSQFVISTHFFQIETMSQEELVKTTKKQMIFLQKLKAKCDDLQSKLAAQADYEEVREVFTDCWYCE